jgi:hypothetical protein
LHNVNSQRVGCNRALFLQGNHRLVVRLDIVASCLQDRPQVLPLEFSTSSLQHLQVGFALLPMLLSKLFEMLFESIQRNFWLFLELGAQKLRVNFEFFLDYRVFVNIHFLLDVARLNLAPLVEGLLGQGGPIAQRLG